MSVKRLFYSFINGKKEICLFLEVSIFSIRSIGVEYFFRIY